MGIVDLAFIRVESSFPLTKIKDNWVVEFVDTEGNHVELTAPVLGE